MPQARRHAERALAIDPSVPEARVVLALVAATYDYDWDEVESQFRLAMTSEPVGTYVRMCHGFYYLLQMGRSRDAVSENQRAFAPDPLNLFCRLHLAICLSVDGRPHESIAQLDYILEIDPTFYLAFLERALVEAGRGNTQQALEDAERAYALAPWFRPNFGFPAGALAPAGHAVRRLYSRTIRTLASTELP